MYLEQLQSIFVNDETTEGTAAAIAAADAVLVRSITKPTAREHHTRQHLASYASRQGKIGAILGAAFEIIHEVKNRGATSNAPEAEELYQTAFGHETVDTGSSTITTGASTTSLPLVSAANFTVGNLVAVETTSTSDLYEVGRITAIAANTLTIAPALTFTPADGAAVQGTTTYAVNMAGTHQSLTIEDYLDAADFVRWVGAKGNMVIDVPGAGAVPLATFAGLAWSWALATTGTRPTPTFDTGLPPAAVASTVKFGAAKTDIRSLNFDLGNVLSALQSQNSALGIYKILVANVMPVGKFSLFPDDSISEWTDWTTNTEVALTFQWGNTRFNGVALLVPSAERTGVAWGESNGVATAEVTFKANITSALTGDVAARSQSPVYLGFF